MLAEEDGPAQPTDRTFRCSICALDWPAHPQYADCPACHEPTTPFSHMKPMDPTEAEKLRLHYEFEAFYEKWDAERPPERLSA